MSAQGDETAVERQIVPQEAVLVFFGLCVFGQGARPREAGVRVPTRVLLTVLERLGVSDAATRAALNRMVHRLH